MRCLLLLLCCFAVKAPARPVLRVLKAPAGAPSLVQNGAFETARDRKVASWTAFQDGYNLAPDEGRNGSAAIVCSNNDSHRASGASQVISLNQRTAAPLVVRGWSKAEDVTGGPDSGYSIYVDLLYSDGTPLWGQTANFRCGSHDWQRREFTIIPDKPVRSLTVHCLFRGHAGEVWFDDIAVEELGRDGAVLFQGVPVQPEPPTAPVATRTVQTDDGLALRLAGSDVVAVSVNGVSFGASATTCGFLARDAAAGSDFASFSNGACSDLRLQLGAEFIPRSNHIVVQGRLSDTTKKDRAVTLVFALPLDGAGWRWHDDIRRSRIIGGAGEFANQVSVRAGSTGSESLYPVAALCNDHTGVALGLDMDRPAVFRLAYHAGVHQLLVAFDFGLVPETERFPDAADFRFVIYSFNPRGRFRSAWQKFVEIFPEQFVVRSHEQGLWMPFTDISKVRGWEDFGFRYHEGNNNVPWDDAHGVLSFRYTEPMTWWMRMDKTLPRTTPNALRVRDELLAGKDASARRLAGVSAVAVMHD